MAEVGDPAGWPGSFVRHNAEDAAWLRGLPGLIERLAECWSLTVGPHFADIRFNFVAPAVRVDGSPCVLKVSRHVDETRGEIAALQLWDGDGAARLLVVEPGLGALLLERLEPGTSLSELADTDDDAATLVAAQVLRQLWQPEPASHGLRSLASWCDAYQRNRTAFTTSPKPDDPPTGETDQPTRGETNLPTQGGMRLLIRGETNLPTQGETRLPIRSEVHLPIRGETNLQTQGETRLPIRGETHLPTQLFLRADALRHDLLASSFIPTVLHGDLHHFNILRAQRAPWLAIDPKGLVGDPCFDVCQFLRNPRHMPTNVTRRRLDVLCAELGLDPQRTRAWCLVHAVLDLCWEYEDGGDWRPQAAYAQETLSF